MSIASVVNSILALLCPPKIEHKGNRLVVSGKNVTTARDLPPLPDAQDRADAKLVLAQYRAAAKKISRQKYDSSDARRAARAKWRAENPAQHHAIIEAWRARNLVSVQASNRRRYEIQRLDPEYLANAAASSRKYHQKMKNDPAYRARRTANQRARNARRKLEPIPAARKSPK